MDAYRAFIGGGIQRNENVYFPKQASFVIAPMIYKVSAFSVEVITNLWKLVKEKLLKKVEPLLKEGERLRPALSHITRVRRRGRVVRQV